MSPEREVQRRVVDITLLYFDDCPHWRLADERLAAIAAERGDLRVTRQLLATPEEADRLGFLGSPSLQVNGVDLFAEPGAQVGLSCRRYPVPGGHEGAPTLKPDPYGAHRRLTTSARPSVRVRQPASSLAACAVSTTAPAR